ncbi:Transcript cleavage factor GreA [Candidatus Rubidus massiliensis]|nr:Transcript cleavage factor GreA [Candidatus Rubidus massiliensis]
MSYLKEIQNQINNRDFSKFLQLWEEYCAGDEVDFNEFSQILIFLKNSEFSKQVGKIIESILPLWETIKDKNEKYEILKLIIDIQNTNSQQLATLTLDAIQEKYPNDPQYNEKLRLIGLRSKDNFQGALSYYDLLTHVDIGKYVYHQGGWGVGEIMDLSKIREQLTVEFENVAGKRHFTFQNAFKALIPLADEHFLARRFGYPDTLEKEAKEDPVKVIKLLLKDLGPKTAAEIKDEMAEYIIPESEWSKWWQTARAKLKKDCFVETPNNLKDTFKLRSKEITQEERMNNTIKDNMNADKIIYSTYNFVKDLPAVKSNNEIRETLKNKLLDLLKEELNPTQELQVLLLLEQFFQHKTEKKQVVDLIKNHTSILDLINPMTILALKKRCLVIIRENREDWVDLFIQSLFTIPQAPLKDYLIQELNKGDSRKKLSHKIHDLAERPIMAPEMLVWYFQKILNDTNQNLPYSDKLGQCQIFESFLILLSQLDSKNEYKDLAKKMYQLLLAKRYEVVRKIIADTDLEFIKEFLLLVSKCQIMTDHDLKIMRSLAEVVHPSLANTKTQKEETNDDFIIWTTEEGYLKTQEKIKYIGTVEIVDNAKEIETARALGDLRENSEFKFAQERRARLQNELKTLSEQMNRARIITPVDVQTDTVGIGCVVDIKDQNNQMITYTILGPWDANPDERILSFQSKFAQAMVGLKEGDSFTFREEKFVIEKLQSMFDKKVSL